MPDTPTKRLTEALKEVKLSLEGKKKLIDITDFLNRLIEPPIDNY